MNKISVFIISKNEADRISRAILSVKEIADEIIVIDSGSTDKTTEIAEQLGAKVYFREWEGYVLQKIYGESLCKNDWILNIDADEELSLELVQEIKNELEGPNNISQIKSDERFQSEAEGVYENVHDRGRDLQNCEVSFKSGNWYKSQAYHLTITMVNRFDAKPRFFAPSNDPIRLYHKRYASFSFGDKSSSYLDSVIAKDDCKIGRLKSIIYHRSGRSFHHWIEKHNNFTSLQAEELYKKGKKVSGFRLVFEFPFSFLKIYFLRRFFIYGIDGFMESVILAFSKFCRIAKLREIQMKEKS